MLCDMPAVDLPEDFVDQLNTSDDGFISMTEGPGVAAYVTEDGRQRADVYIGLKLDGFTRYRNISRDAPEIKFRFALKPNVSCRSDELFRTERNTLVVIKVRKTRNILFALKAQRNLYRTLIF